MLDPLTTRLVGVLDFSGAGIGDVHLDFRYFFCLDPHLLDAVLKQYTETYKQAWVRSIALLLDDDGQVHIQVDATVEMVGAGRVEWSTGHTLTGSVELQVGDDRCTRFSRWFDDVIHPGAIANNV